MLMVSVQSSNVARVGHEDTILRVEFKDGKVYEWADISHELYIALLTSPSKGKFIARHLRGGVSTEGTPCPAEKHGESRTLQTFDVDPCCNTPMVRALAAGSIDEVKFWECPKCGSEWKCTQIGDIRHWSPVPLIAVF